MSAKERLMKYCMIDTQSDPTSETTPSTLKQFDLAKVLVEELKEVGVNDVELDEHCYIYAHVNANVDQEVPVVGFVAHMDTAPDFSGKDVKPRIIENYDGKDIVLNDTVVTKVKDFPQLKNAVGKTLMVTDGNTLLGADDKAGIACIMEALAYLHAHPEVPHGKIAIAFTPDEEIGRGTIKFDVSKFGADFAYTMDGDTISVMADETFNAAYAKLKFKGFSIHPGEAKDKMINAASVLCKYSSLLPEHATPEHTTGKDGFIHLVEMSGNIEEASCLYIVRDHDRSKLDEKLALMQSLVSYLNTYYGSDVVEIETGYNYRNMKEILDQYPNVSKIAAKSIEELGYVVKNVPIRGGTDGAELSFKGVPCPNLGCGGGNFHGRYEYCVVEELEDSSKLVCKIIENVLKEGSL